MDSMRHELRRLRRARKMTQADVARHLGVRQATVSAFELGTTRSMRQVHYDKIMELLHAWRGGHDSIIPFGLPPMEDAIPSIDHGAPPAPPTPPPQTASARSPVMDMIIRACGEVLGSQSEAENLTASMDNADLLRTFIAAQELRSRK